MNRLVWRLVLSLLQCKSDNESTYLIWITGVHVFIANYANAVHHSTVPSVPAMVNLEICGMPPTWGPQEGLLVVAAYLAYGTCFVQRTKQCGEREFVLSIQAALTYEDACWFESSAKLTMAARQWQTAFWSLCHTKHDLHDCC